MTFRSPSAGFKDKIEQAYLHVGKLVTMDHTLLLLEEY